MFRHPMEIEIFVEARQKEVEELYWATVLAIADTQRHGVLGHARHLLGTALIVTGDHIAGDDSLRNRAQANDHSCACHRLRLFGKVLFIFSGKRTFEISASGAGLRHDGRGSRSRRPVTPITNLAIPWFVLATTGSATKTGITAFAGHRAQLSLLPCLAGR